MNEHDIQKEAVRIIDEYFILKHPEYCIELVNNKLESKITSPLFAVPNAARRGVKLSSWLKAEGMKSGVPDLILPIPSGMHNGLFIEMKKPGGKTNKQQIINQNEWKMLLENVGYRCETINSAGKALETVMEYLNANPKIQK